MDWLSIKKAALERDGAVWGAGVPAQIYTGLAAAPDPARAAEPDILYFCPLSQLLLRPAEPSACFLCWQDVPLPAEPLRCGCLLLPSEAQLDALCDQLQGLLHREAQLNALLRRLISAHAAGIPLQDFADLISAFFGGRPVFVVDCTLSLLAASQKIDSRLRMDLQGDVELGYVTPNIFQEMQILPARPMEAIRTQILEDSLKTIWNYHTPICVGSAVIGYLDVFCSLPEHLDTLELSYLGQLADLLGAYLQRGGSPLTADTGPATLLLAAALRRDAPAEQLDKRLRGLGYDLRRFQRLLVLRSDDLSLSDSALYLLGRSTHQLFENSLYTVCERSLVFLVSYSDAAQWGAAKLAAWEELLAHDGLRLGVSTQSRSLASLQDLLTEARRALAVGAQMTPGRRVCLYDRLRFASQVNLLAETCGDTLYQHYYPPLLELLAYDAAHGTPLTQTLYLLLRHPRDQLFICAQLHIHRNTLYARLRRLHDFLPENFDSIDTAAQIYTTLLLLQRAGKLYFKLEMEDLP